MQWTKVTKSPNRDDGRNDDAAVPSRRNVLAGIGFASLLAVAGSRLLISSPAEAREPEAAPTGAAKAEVAGRDVAESNLADLERGESTEFSSQYWYGRRRRYWRRRYRWRRRYWRRRHYWGWRRRRYWGWRRRRYWRRRYWRRRYYW